MTFLHEVEAAIPALRRYALALARDPDRADDLVQDCLERALARRHLWRAEGPVRSWMFAILLNLLRDEERRRPSRGHLVPIEELAAVGRPGGQEARLAWGEMLRALDRLPPDQRRALLIVTVGGLSLAEAAAATGVPEGTLVSRLGRARAALRLMLGRDRDETGGKEG